MQSFATITDIGWLLLYGFGHFNSNLRLLKVEGFGQEFFCKLFPMD
jgi:hypothetical protein